MNKLKYKITLDMLEVTTQKTLKAKRGDTACSIIITLTENGKVYEISEGCYAVFSAKKPDGNYLFNSETCYIKDNTIIYDFTAQTTPCEGTVECEVILYKDQDKLTSPRFNLVVDETVYNGEEIISSTETDALNSTLKEIREIAEGATSVADEALEKAEATQKEVNALKPKYTKDDINPIFSNNSWELIKWVCQHDDPAKYWKVGDYKLITYPEVTRSGYISDSTSGKNLFFQTRNGTRPSPYSLGTITLKYPHKLVNLIETKDYSGYDVESGAFRIYTYLWAEDKIRYSFSFFAMGSTYPTIIVYEAPSFEQLLEDMGAVITKTVNGETYLTDENLSIYGVHINEGFSYKAGKVYNATQYPIMILGFNHDNVSNPYEYGKSKSGITLCLGITRAVTENSPPYHWDTAILPNLYESGVSQFDSAKSNDTMMSPYWLGDGETNWETCQFREELQHLLDNTEIADKLVSVEKTTATGMWQESNNYFPKVFTNDKISLLSEYEIIGTSKHSNAQEGEQYEFFKRGNSRFYWNTALVSYGKWAPEDEANRLYLWLRSPINPESFSSGVEKPLDYKGGCNLQCNLVLKGATSDNSIATITDVYKLANSLSSFTSPNKSIYDLIYTVTIQNGNYYKIKSDNEEASWVDDAIIPDLKEIKSYLLNTYGIKVYSEQPDITFTFTITRNERVGYAQGANGITVDGTLLPIFCM